jgi:hypothetical protein
MAFCNSCGANLAPGAQFCTKCGASTAAPSTSPDAAATPASAPPSTGGTSALKVILIVVGVIVCIGILGVATIGVIGYRIAKSSHVTQEGEHVKVETPFGTISANDPDQAVKDLGVEVYPGAQVQKQGAADMTIGPVHTVTAIFQSSDSVDKVCDFYKSQFPSAAVKSSDPNRCAIVSNDSMNNVTINVEAAGDTTKFTIAHVTKKSSN